MIEKYLGDGSGFGVDIEYVKENEELGTGGGGKAWARGRQKNLRRF